MKARILDQMALQAISPSAMRAYLVYEGWKRLESFGEFSEVYNRSRNAVDEELVVPVSTSIADYASSVAQVLRLIASFEERDELAIYGDLVRADRDVIRVRAPEADSDGSIEIDPGVELVQHARDMLASAACAAFDPRPAYHLVQRFQSSNHIRRLDRVCRSRCGRPGPD